MPEPAESGKAPPSLRIELLGSPRFRAGEGEAVPLPGLPAAFLAYVALSERPVTREHLAELFWPRSDRSRALQSVRQTLTRLRGLFGREVVGGNGALELGNADTTLDVHALRDALEAGRVEEALELWRGPLLDGFRRPESWEVEDWLERERSRLDRRLVVAVESRVRELAAAGAAGQAAELVRRGRGVFPLDEELSALEVEALAAAGRADEAEGALAGLDGEMDPDLRRRAEGAVEALRDQAGALRIPPGPRVTGGQFPGEAGRIGGVSGAGAPPRGSNRRWRRLALTLPAGLVLLGGALYLGSSALAEHRSRVLSRSYPGIAVIFCTDRATEGRFPQPFRMELDGSGKHRITQDPTCALVPQPDGSLLGWAGVGDLALYRYRPDPENPQAEWHRTLVPGTEGLRRPWGTVRGIDAEGGFWFSAEDPRGQRDIFRLLPGADSVVRITDDPWAETSIALDPTDPDGPVVFVRFAGTGSDEHALIRQGGDLWAIPRSGGPATRLTRDERVDRGPIVRSDSVLFTRGLGEDDEDGSLEILLLHLGEAREEALTQNDWNDFGVNWSPDGRHICWQSEESGHYESDILVMDLVTRATWVLAGEEGQQRNCIWTPDGRGILYQSSETGDREIYLRPVRGGPAVRLTRYPGEDGASPTFISIPGSR